MGNFTRSKSKQTGQAQTENFANAEEGVEVNDKNDDIKPTLKRKKKTAKAYATELLIKMILTAAVVWVLCSFVIGVHVNHSNSAYPMIKDGDLCITYRLSEITEGDEIAYRYNGQLKFGRIVAKGGDAVEIKNGCVMVDGYNILEDVVYSTTEEGSLIDYPYTVKDGCVFVLNDFRSDISDSRSLGAVSLSDVEGKVVFLIRRRGI